MGESFDYRLSELIRQRAWVEIDQQALVHNVQQFKSLLKPHTALMAVVKADAYGHGAVRVSQTVLEAGATALAIATLGGTIYFYFSDPQLPLIIMVVVVSIMFALAGWHWRWQHPNFIAILIIGSYCSLSFLFMSQSWLWEINEAFPVKPIGEIIRTATPANSEIFTTFSYRRPSLDFYGDRPVRPAPLETLQPGQYWLIDQEIFNKRVGRFPPHQILGETPEFKLIHTLS